MANFSFKTNLIAVMRVRASDEMLARKVVPTALRGPSAVEIRLANEGSALLHEGAIVTNVDFSVEEGSIELIETVRMSELPRMTTGSKRALATCSRRGVRIVECANTQCAPETSAADGRGDTDPAI
jgi:hypothetical protein